SSGAGRSASRPGPAPLRGSRRRSSSAQGPTRWAPSCRRRPTPRPFSCGGATAAPRGSGATPSTCPASSWEPSGLSSPPPGPDRLYADAPNLVGEYAVTAGLRVLNALLAGLGLAIRRAAWSAPRAGFSLFGVAWRRSEPQTVALTRLALLALASAASLGAPPA